MKIEPKSIPIKEIYAGYTNDEKGVIGYKGMLNIQPAFQRNFIYSDEQQIKVIESIIEGFPLSDIYWGETDDGTYEIIDGQQRITSICKFINGEFHIIIDGYERYYHTIDDPKLKDKIDNYELQVHLCSGTHDEKMRWFEIINTAGEELSRQELRNAVYSGSWVYDAKRYFGIPSAPGTNMLKPYLSSSIKTDRQGVLELVLKWYTDNKINEYMADNKDKPDAKEIWEYAQEIVEWIEKTFGAPDKAMQGVQWGFLYNNHKDDKLNPDEIAKRIKKLMADSEIKRKSGIYEYILTGNESKLELRFFEEPDKRKKYDEQKGICPQCKEHFKYEEMEGDHKKKWKNGGKTVYENLQMLCQACNRSS